jgi:phosphoribosylformimino-5-aminoimidazole carboxamide ribotide isomerase
VILLPAIDVRGGRAVRLEQGDYDRETTFDADPLAAAKRWVEQGARGLHVVDLDGAREGRPANVVEVEAIAGGVGVPVQVGGGLRTAEAVATVLDAGAERAVLGTAALEDPALIEALVAEHAERIVVAADARRGRIAVEGWERESAIGASDLIRDLAGRGVRRFIYTPVEVDGTLRGPATEELAAVAGVAAAAGAELLYSGGIGSLEHLRRLAGLALPALSGVIVGRALYEGVFTVGDGERALAAASGDGSERR